MANISKKNSSIKLDGKAHRAYLNQKLNTTVNFVVRCCVFAAPILAFLACLLMLYHYYLINDWDSIEGIVNTILSVTAGLFIGYLNQNLQK